MGKGVNKVIILGNLGRDPEVTYMPSGDAVCNMTVATSESWKDKDSGENKEKTEWHRIVLFKRLGEIAGEYLKKGSKVYIEGKLQTRKWQAQDGSDRYSTEVVASNLQMLDSRGQSANPKATPSDTPSSDAGQFGDFDDDIPFMRFQDNII